MVQRSTVWRSWLRCRNERPENKRVREFFELMEAHPGDCWHALVPTFRSQYEDVIEEIVSVVVRTDDPLIIFNCFQFADLSKPRELAIIRKFIEECDPDRHSCTLKFLSRFKACEFQLRRRGLLG